MNNSEKQYKLNIIRKTGILFIISAPSGAGKTSIYKELLKNDPTLKYSVSVTTRPKRQDEVNGRDYYFVTLDEFKRLVENGELLEWAEVHGNYYGTPKKFINDNLKNGQDVLIDVDVKGGTNIRNIYPDGVFIFIMASSFEKLRSRLKMRGTEDENTIRERLEVAKQEVAYIQFYNYLVINEDLQESIRQVQSIISAERNKVKHYTINIE